MSQRTSRNPTRNCQLIRPEKKLKSTVQGGRERTTHLYFCGLLITICTLCFVPTVGLEAGNSNSANCFNVLSSQKITASMGGFSSSLDIGDSFGGSLARIGDLDKDGVEDLAVGADHDDDGEGVFTHRGAIWILFLNRDGSVKSYQKISATSGGLSGELNVDSRFGVSMAPLGDLDQDGMMDIAVGASNDCAVWILFLNLDGTVKASQKISSMDGDLGERLADGDEFGRSVAAVGDLNGDGCIDIAVGAPGDDDHGGYGGPIHSSGLGYGAVYLLFLHQNGTVKSSQKISAAKGGFAGKLSWIDAFGTAVSALNDLDGDDVPDLAVGAPFGDDYHGVVWILFLNRDGSVKSHRWIGSLDDDDSFGTSITVLRGCSNDAGAHLAVGAPRARIKRDTRATGTLWIVSLDSRGAAQACNRLNMALQLQSHQGGALGSAVASLGDLNNDGFADFAIGAPSEVVAGKAMGAIWILFSGQITASGD